MSGQGKVKGKNTAFFYIFGPGRLGGPKYLKLTQSAKLTYGLTKYCISAKVMLNKFRVKVRSQKVTKNKVDKRAVRYMFSGSFGT